MSWENVVLAEAEDRRREHRNNLNSVTPDLAQAVADLSFTYPNLSGGVVTGMAVSGVPALSPEAQALDARNESLEAAGLNVVEPRNSFWDHGLGRITKGVTRGAFTIFQSFYDEITKGITSFGYGLGGGLSVAEAARGSFGKSSGALAIAAALQGREVNLGAGFFPDSNLSPETEENLAAGMPWTQAISNQAQMALGIPLAGPGGLSRESRQQKGIKIRGSEGIVDERSGMQGLLVTPGRVIANTVLEPGSKAFNMFSGVTDFAANIFLDPANVVPFGLIGDLRKANKALVGGTRPTVIARNIDRWLDSRHGVATAKYFADTSDFLTLHGLFRKNAPRSNVDVATIKAIRDTDDPAEVKQILSALGHGGTGGVGALTELPVKQGLIGRMTQTSGLAGILARGVGQSSKAVDVTGLRAMMRSNRETTSLLGKWAAEVGTTSLRLDNIDTSVDDFGQWLQAAGFDKGRISHFMSSMAGIKPGGIEVGPEMWGVVKAAYKELGQQLQRDGIPKPIAEAFTKAFNSIEEYRKFWLDNAGHPMLFAGGRYNIMTNGKVQAIPTAQLFSEFLDWSIPLLDMRKIRRALNRASWSRHGFEEAAQKRIKGQFKDDKLLPRFNLETMTDWDDLGPSVAGALLDTTIQRVWKPLVLLRIAWPVRVIAEEQVRMLAVGMDNIYNHPLHGMMLMFNKGYRKGFQATDVAGKNFEDAVAFRNAMSRRGIEYGLGTKRNIFSGEWLKKGKQDPEYWDGWVIQLQQSADDPIIARIAQALIDDPDASAGDVLRVLKTEFATDGTELGNLRRALAVDASNWKLLSQRSMADTVIDDRYARLLQMTGGDFVKFDHIRGNLLDSFQNKVPFDPKTRSYTGPDGQQIFLDEPPAAGVKIEMQDISREVEAMESEFLTMSFRSREYLFADPLDPHRLISEPGQIEEWASSLERLDALLRGAERPGTERWVDELYRDFMDPREMAQRLRVERGGLLADDSLVVDPIARDLNDNLENMLRRAKADAVDYVDLTGRARTDAADMIAMSGNRNPDAIRDLHAGYTPGTGQPSIDDLAEKEGWSLEEISDMISGDIEFGSFDVTRLSEEYRNAGAVEEGTSIFLVPLAANQDAIYISHDGFVTGKIILRRDPTTGKVVDVDMFHVAKGDARTIWYDPDKASAMMSKAEAEEASKRAVRQAEVRGETITPERPEDLVPHGYSAEYIAPGGNSDAYKLLKYIVSPPKGSGLTPIDPQDIYDLAFGGVPIREWFRASGISDEVLGGDPVFSLQDIAEFMRVQHGSAWAGKTGPMGRIPSISLSPDGAHSLARAVIAMGDGGSLSRRLFDDDLSKTAQGWPQKHTMTQATRAPDPELLEAVATGQLRGKTLSFRDVLDEQGRVAKTADLSETLKAVRNNSTEIGPEYVKVAAPADERKLDSAVDHLFDWFMSRPTNTLSRSPAFKQFYWRRISEMLVYMDAPTRKAAIEAARKAGISKRKLNSMADDFVSTRARFTEAADDITSLDDADDIGKAFALHETKRLLYDLTKKTQFFDITRNIFPFGEAWYEIMTTWARLISENPKVLRRFQQGIEGARQQGFFYNDPATDEEVFAMPHMNLLGKAVGALPGFADPSGLGGEEGIARPQYAGRVDGVNLALNNYLPGIGPLLQMPLGAFAQDFMMKPEMRWARDLVFPFGFTDAKDPGALVNSVMPAWFRKGMVALGRPTGDDQRLFNNTVIDVLRAMELNQEILPNASPEDEAKTLEIARSRARTIYAIRSLQQFIGPTGAQVRWDVEVDEDGTAFAYQVLATEYRQMIEDNGGDRVQAFFDFVNQYGFDPAGIATAKTEQLRPRSVIEEGLDFQNANQELFDRYGLTAYYVAPDSPDGQFDYNAYLNQLRNADRVGLTPEQWNTERNRLLGSIQYEKVRRAAVDADIRNRPEVSAYLRAIRFNLMAQYPGYGFDNVGVVTQPEQQQFMAEFDTWSDDPRLADTQAGTGLALYLAARDRALALAASQFGISEEGFANAKSSAILRQYLLAVGTKLMREHPDFGVIFQRHYLWEVEDAEPVAPTSLLGVDLDIPEEVVNGPT